MVQITSSEDGWLPLAQAAERLGVAKHAARRRIQRGELQARQVRTRYGMSWQVCSGRGTHEGSMIATYRSWMSEGRTADATVRR